MGSPLVSAVRTDLQAARSSALGVRGGMRVVNEKRVQSGCCLRGVALVSLGKPLANVVHPRDPAVLGASVGGSARGTTVDVASRLALIYRRTFFDLSQRGRLVKAKGTTSSDRGNDIRPCPRMQELGTALAREEDVVTEHKNLKRLIRERQARTGESYTTARRHLIADQPSGAVPDPGPPLRALIALLGEPAPRFQSVRVTYRVWRHEERLREARHADIEAARAGGGSITTYGRFGGDPQPSETEHSVDVWRQNDGFRYEIHGGQQDGLLGVATNGFWWWSQPGMATRSNEADPSSPNPVKGLPFMLDPEKLLDLLEFEVTGHSEVAGRATISARATRLPPTELSGIVMALYPLGGGADHYELEVDADHGVLLEVAAIYEGERIQTIEAQMIQFDETIPLDVFTFELPEG